MIKTIIRKFAGTHEKSKLLVFNFHNIFTNGDLISKNSIDETIFIKQVHWIKSHFDVLPLDHGVQACRAGKLIKPSACITFDDGYFSHLTIAAKLLKELKLPATFFVSSGHFNEILWNDYLELFEKKAPNKSKQELKLLINKVTSNTPHIPRKSLEDRLKYLTIEKRKPIIKFIKNTLEPLETPQIMLNKTDVKRLSEMGFDIGGHTVDHPILSMESNLSAQKEIKDDLDALSSTLTKAIDKFAYPNGKPNLDYNSSHIEILIRAGINYAVISHIGSFQAGSDLFQIPRVNLNGKSEINYLRTIISAYNTQLSFVEAFGYENIN